MLFFIACSWNWEFALTHGQESTLYEFTASTFILAILENSFLSSSANGMVNSLFSYSSSYSVASTRSIYIFWWDLELADTTLSILIIATFVTNFFFKFDEISLVVSHRLQKCVIRYSTTTRSLQFCVQFEEINLQTIVII